MSKLHLAIGAGLVGALSLFALSAASDGVSARGWKGGEHHGGYGRHHGGGRKSFRKLRRLDADGNGEVTKTEFLAPKEKRFSELDANGDGKLSSDELFKEMDETVDYRVRRALKDYDFNGDGKISKDDYEADARERFAKRGSGSNDKTGESEKPTDSAEGTPNAQSAEKPSDDRMDEGRGEGGRHGWRGRDHKRGGHHGWRGHGGKRWGKTRSLDDVLERRGERFARLDTNNDGFVDADEIRARGADRMAYKKKNRMNRLDTDNDGSVSKEEYLARSQARFSRLDLDGDGTITAKDLPPRAARHWAEKSGKRD